MTEKKLTLKERLNGFFEKKMPWFKKYDKEWIDLYASAIRKVVENYEELLEGDIDKTQGGRWHGNENAADQQKKDK